MKRQRHTFTLEVKGIKMAIGRGVAEDLLKAFFSKGLLNEKLSLLDGVNRERIALDDLAHSEGSLVIEI